MPKIEWVGSPNYGVGRGGYAPIAIVDHITQGDYPGCLIWMQNRVSKASAHFIITKAGEILQLVKEENRAHHAGVVNNPTWKLYNGHNPNYYTIGIEHEGWSGAAMPEAQYQTTLWLHDYLIKKFRLPIHSDHIIGHFRINADHAGCPGTGFPWTRLFQDLQDGKIKEEDNIMLNFAVLLHTEKDFWAGVDIAVRHNCGIFIREVGGTVPAEAWNAKKLVVVGGPTTGHPGEVLVSGDTRFETAAAVGKYLG
jgi:N-acetyl-anhydromuramyl-L-alanine amidase AmpD